LTYRSRILNTWDLLHEEFAPVNAIIASGLKRDLYGYTCEEDMDVHEWILNMRNLYHKLIDADPQGMTDEEFGRILFDLLPDTPLWRQYMSSQREKFTQAGSKGIRSRLVIESIRAEYAAQHRRDPTMQSSVFSARATAARKRSATESQGRSTRDVKKPKLDKSSLVCTNCSRQYHTAENCYWPGGGKEGQFPSHWKGRPDLASSKKFTPRANQTEAKPGLAERITSPEANQVHAQDINLENDTGNEAYLMDRHVWLLKANESDKRHEENIEMEGAEKEPLASCKVPVLNMLIAKSDHFYHDSGANRHIAHDRAIFSEYMSIKPISVSAFGDKLATHAIGIGSVDLIGSHDGAKSAIRLRNVLHIPSARSNLISQIQLDKIGVTAKMGRGRIVLEKEGRVIISGNVQSDMYRLDVVPDMKEEDIESVTAAMANLKVSPGFYTAWWATSVTRA
jgi:hypothetical protein